MIDPVREVVAEFGAAALDAEESLGEPDAAAERAAGPTPTPTA